MKKQNVHEYLEQQALELGRELSDSEVAAFKKAYRKDYLKGYKKKYRKKHKTLTVSLTRTEYERFEELVRQSGKKARTYIKDSLLNARVLSPQPKIYEVVLEVIDLLDEGLFESHFGRVKEALVQLNKLKNQLI